MANFADFQTGLYFQGFSGELPRFPLTYDDLESKAREILEKRLWDYVDGGAGDGSTQRANIDAFSNWGIWPRMLTGASERDLSIELFGHHLPTPLVMSPIGVIGVMTEDQHGDIAVARASARSGVPMVASTLMADPMEEVAKSAGFAKGNPALFQLYPPSDHDITASFIQRAEASGFSGIVITLDTLSLGYRPRDIQHATFPQLRGQGLANYFSDPVFRSQLSSTPEEDPTSATLHWASIFTNPSFSWSDLPRLRELTHLPILLKGICHPDDVRRARDEGIDGIYCSNHGGRQAASGAALDFLPGVVEAAEGLPVIFDSGVRNGVDVVKALALGATAVGIGRPYGYGAAIGGQEGIEFVLSCLLAEADLTMSLNGYASIVDLTPEILFQSTMSRHRTV